MVEQTQDGVLIDMDEEELEHATGGWVIFPPNKKELALKCEVNMESGWDNPQTPSIKFGVTVIEDGENKGKTSKISTGINAKAIPILKQYLAALIDPATGKVGVDYKSVFDFVETADGKRKSYFKIDKFVGAIVGKQTYGIWRITTGKKGGRQDAEDVSYPKLITLSATPLETVTGGV